MIGLVSQSNFVPWRGYFASARIVDLLVFYDSQQFTRRDWRNRNVILSANEPVWLTLPVNTAGKYFSSICEIQLSEPNWISKVIDKLKNSYAGGINLEGLSLVTSILESCQQFSLLSEVNWYTTKAIADYLEISCRFDSDNEVALHGDKNQKLISVCEHFGINQYLSGPSAKSYLEVAKFEESKIFVDFIDFNKLPRVEVIKEPSILHWLLTQTKEECIELTTFAK